MEDDVIQMCFNNTRDKWGWELMMNCGKCNDAIDDREKILAFKDELIDVIDMVQYGEPLLVSFGEGHLAGYTLVQLIRTSNLTIHFSKETKSFYLNLFSCKEFFVEDVLECIKKHFHAEEVEYNFFERGI